MNIVNECLDDFFQIRVLKLKREMVVPLIR